MRLQTEKAARPRVPIARTRGKRSRWSPERPAVHPTRSVGLLRAAPKDARPLLPDGAARAWPGALLRAQLPVPAPAVLTRDFTPSGLCWKLPGSVSEERLDYAHSGISSSRRLGRTKCKERGTLPDGEGATCVGRTKDLPQSHGFETTSIRACGFTPLRDIGAGTTHAYFLKRSEPARTHAWAVGLESAAKGRCSGHCVSSGIGPFRFCFLDFVIAPNEHIRKRNR